VLRALLPVLLVVACSSTSGPVATRSPTTAPEGVAVTVGPKPCGVLSAAGAVWVSEYGADDVVRLDPATHQVLSRARTGAAPCGMAYGAGSVWVEDYSGSALTRVDARTGRTVTDYAVGDAPYDVAFAAGAAWSTDYNDGTLTRIDASTGRSSKVRVGGSPTGIAPAAGALWVANGTTDLVRVDPVSSRVVGRVALGLHGSWTAYDDRHVWVTDTPAGDVVVVDALAGRLVARVHTGGRPADGDAVEGVAWFPDRDGGSVVGVDARGQVVGRHAVGLTDPFVLDSVGRTLWVGDFGGDTVRVLPLS
jgi:hypothetical protein